jgi:hypothetical protein
VEVVDMGSIPAESVLNSLFHDGALTGLAGGHGVACFALPGPLNSRAFYEALIEHSADIDATTRQHVAFVVFYGDRSRVVRRVNGYRPFNQDHLERYQINGLSTSRQTDFEIPRFSVELADAFRFRPGTVDKQSLYHSMSDCSTALLSLFDISHSSQPCLLFVDPGDPTRHIVVELCANSPLQSLMSDALVPLSDAFRSLSAHWRARDEALSRIRILENSRNTERLKPVEILRLKGDLAELDGQLSDLPQQEARDWSALQDRLKTLARAQDQNSEISGDGRVLNTVTKYCEELAAALPSPSRTLDQHVLRDRRAKIRRLSKRSDRSEVKQLCAIVNEIDRIAESRKGLHDRAYTLRSAIDYAERDLDNSRKTLASYDPIQDKGMRASLVEAERKLLREGFNADVLQSHCPSAFEVVETLHRTGRVGTKATPMARRGPAMRILFMLSNPQTTEPLDLEEEVRSVQHELQAARFRGDIDLRVGHAMRPDDVIRMLRDYQPTIVHFSGHGSPNGVALRSESGLISVSGEALARVFRNRNVSLIVLNSCYSENQGAFLRNVVPVVVGTTNAVDDAAARRFATAFYRTLGNGYSVGEAFRDAGDAVAIHALSDVFVAHGHLDKIFCGSSANTEI